MTAWLVELSRRIRAFFRGDEMDSDFDSEMAAHLELAIEDNVSRGMSPEEARRRVLVRFGRALQARELHREARGLPAIEALGQDVKYTLRTFGRERGFVLIVLLILGLGIGANVAVFSVVDTILLKPLPFPDSQRLCWLTVGKGHGGLSSVTYTVDAYEEFQRHNQSFQDVTSYNPFLGNGQTKLLGGGEPEPVDALMIAGNFFQTLGVQPIQGRLFLPEECVKNGQPVMLLGYAFWQRQFGGDPSIVGQAITIDLFDTPATVVGVLPRSFDFGSVFSPGQNMDVYIPAPMDSMRRWGNTLALVGRLKSGISVAQAQAEANILFPQLKAAHPEWWGDYGSTIMELKDYVSGKLRRALTVLWCAVGLIMLIVCVNLTNLLLGRAASRSKEFAMRSALGAGRGRIVRQLLTESLTLTVSGAAFGLALAFGLTWYISHQGTIALPLLGNVGIDGRAVGWTVLIAAGAALALGLLPGLKMASRNLQDALKESGAGLTRGRRGDGLRSILVISETALACVLLVGAGLLVRSLLRVLDQDLGFQPSRAAVISVDYDDGVDRARRGAILKAMLDRVSEIPSVESAGISDMLPLGRNRSWGLAAKGRIYRDGDDTGVFVRIATPGYLSAMGMRLVEGRDFNWQDTASSAPVIIINEAAARYHWPGQDALGREAYFASKQESTVVGIVADVRQNSLEESPTAEVFAPATQADPEGAELVIRSNLPPESLTPTVMSTLRALNRNQPVAALRPIQQIVDHAVSPRRFVVFLVAAFAALGLVLAALGIYGVVSFSVTRQTQEIGIRRALGATARQVQLGVLKRTLRLALAGVALGTVASLGEARLIGSLLFGTKPTDVPTFLVVVAVLSIVALLAGYVPARRASNIDPMVALRAN
ncbi:MAG TPA: ABC transporter permease [Blastocatellia bacterium]